MSFVYYLSWIFILCESYNVFCPPGTFPSDLGNCVTCTTGYYCPDRVPKPIQCPLGFFCKDGASFPIKCPPGWNCPIGTNYPMSCQSLTMTLNRPIYTCT